MASSHTYGSLPDDEVRSIFRSVSNRRCRCEREYKVIASGPKVSLQVPAFEFDEGIYILCDDQRSDFPRHLRAKVVDSASFEQCKWKIVSGPINTSPTDLQMRACTPASGVGKRGHLWTRIVDGKDDLSFRIFHVLPDSSGRSPPQNEDHSFVDGCMRCGRDDDYPTMLVCSFCENRYCHIRCLGLDSVPEGDWLCGDFCMQQNELLNKLKEQKDNVEEESEHEEDKSVSEWSKATDSDDESVIEQSEAEQKSKSEVHLLSQESEKVPTDITAGEEVQSSGWGAALRVSAIVPTSIETAKRPAQEFTMTFSPSKQPRTTQQMDAILRPDVVESACKPEVIVINSDEENRDSSDNPEEDSKVPPNENDVDEDSKQTSNDTEEGNHGSDDTEEDSKLPPDGSASRPLVLYDVKEEEDDAPAGDNTAHDLAGDSADAGTGTQRDVYFRLTRRELDLDGAVLLGFITAETRNATFADLRAIIERELNLASPWTFYFPSLGPVNLSQETSLGSVADRLERANDASLGDGTFVRPFCLSILM